MEEGAKLHLKEWLVAQIESDSYDGLCWEDEDKTMFRIPWKHAAKKDYKQTEDAALFKAWAVYKGKYQEGRDKADPTMWKTRLRCALNKSTDFEEIPERNQLDITEPYKVYRIQQDSSSTKPAVTNYQMMHQVKQSPRSPGYQDKQKELFQSDKEEKTCSEVLMREHVYCEVMEKKNQIQAPAPVKFLSPTLVISALQNNLQGKGQMPSYQIELCFGEEYPDPIVPKTRKLIMAQVVPLFAVELMRRLNLGQSQEKRLNLSSNSAGKMTLEG
ncbi:transcript variant X3 [Nothobranchius furzeri]|uniref:Transcript variant X3 n=1 Tax=Nothobranchius furzeri TaxID=105023 RepID=A0A9D2XXF9_NOTFU|nr:interferon regulatory factor 10 isoform X5 [Nothobranchius furzeri]KAF7210177.1 transcript variant X3 [Nothobranchius furzeri]